MSIKISVGDIDKTSFQGHTKGENLPRLPLPPEFTVEDKVEFGKKSIATLADITSVDDFEKELRNNNSKIIAEFHQLVVNIAAKYFALERVDDIEQTAILNILKYRSYDSSRGSQFGAWCNAIIVNTIRSSYTEAQRREKVFSDVQDLHKANSDIKDLEFEDKKPSNQLVREDNEEKQAALGRFRKVILSDTNMFELFVVIFKYQHKLRCREVQRGRSRLAREKREELATAMKSLLRDKEFRAAYKEIIKKTKRDSDNRRLFMDITNDFNEIIPHRLRVRIVRKRKRLLEFLGKRLSQREINALGLSGFYRTKKGEPSRLSQKR